MLNQLLFLLALAFEPAHAASRCEISFYHVSAPNKPYVCCTANMENFVCGTFAKTLYEDMKLIYPGYFEYKSVWNYIPETRRQPIVRACRGYNNLCEILSQQLAAMKTLNK